MGFASPRDERAVTDNTDVIRIMEAGMSVPAPSGQWDGYQPYNRLAKLAVAALEAAGFLIVPKEPTDAMIEAGNKPFDEPFVGGRLTDPCRVWEAMINAAPMGRPSIERGEARRPSLSKGERG
jgi:hypothetical protein